MKVIVVGDGKVGYTLTEQLSREGHDVVVIDNNAAALTDAIRRILESVSLRRIHSKPPRSTAMWITSMYGWLTAATTTANVKTARRPVPAIST